MLPIRSIVVAVALGMTSWSGADEIVVEPGAGTISAAVARAKAGDVIRLTAGQFRDTIKVPGDITIQGEGAGESIIVAEDYAAIRIEGERVRIVAIEFRSEGERTTRGIDTDTSVRVEGCRFVKFKEAIALRGAPLSDVVHCEFVDCGIGVRAIAEASPTIWGCVFRTCNTGVFVLDGGPNIRENLFDRCVVGLRLVSRQMSTICVRNNVMLDCSKAAIELVAGDMPISLASIRNNVMRGGPTAIIGKQELLNAVSNNVVFGQSGTTFADEAGAVALTSEAAAKQENLLIDPGVKVQNDGEVTMANSASFADKGLRDCDKPKDAVGRIGLSLNDARPGCDPGVNAAQPPVRWIAPEYIANAVAEEYACLRMWGLPMGGQKLVNRNGRSYDELRIQRDGKAETIRFDVTGFMCEMTSD